MNALECLSKLEEDLIVINESAECDVDQKLPEIDFKGFVQYITEVTNIMENLYKYYKTCYKEASNKNL